MDYDRFARQISLPEIGPDGQAKIRNSAVLVVGLGGLGSPVCEYLVGAGIGRLGLCDNDVVSESNLHRQVLYSSSMLGKPKTECAHTRLSSMSPYTEFELWNEGLTSVNSADIIAKYDIVVDCVDNFGTRYLISDTCRNLKKPWIYGSIGCFSGQLAVMNGRKKLQYDDIYPDRGILTKEVASKGVLGPVPGIIGTMQAMQALMMIAEFGEPLDGRLFTMDLKTFQTNILEFD